MVGVRLTADQDDVDNPSLSGRSWQPILSCRSCHLTFPMPGLAGGDLGRPDAPLHPRIACQDLLRGIDDTSFW